MEPIRVAMLGAGNRALYLYRRLIDAIDDVELVGAWSRSDSSAKRLGEELGVPWFTSMERLKRETGAVAGIVTVSYGANGAVGLEAVSAGFHILTETPIAHDLAEADEIIRVAAANGVHVEVAEQFHRRPLEQLKLALIEAGVFGRVYSSFNDFVGHGYHGVSVMRSYLGFDAKPVRVVGSVHDYPLASHYAMISGKTAERKETQEHGIVEFDDGRVGIFHWTSVGYDSGLRWFRGSRFYAERGMGVMHGTFNEPICELTRIGPDGHGPVAITVQRELERCDGGALTLMRALTGDPERPTVEWRNPFGQAEGGRNPEWHDDEIGVAGCILSLVDAVRSGSAPSYGGEQARLDQEIILAIRASAAAGNTPIALPMERA
ncbi:MAG: gfo/Idh/MocA family oxidoreductase [Spirochaetaceae bacterium]|nr:MAG: gfo/Idh/MocA family oxidoreductase [Spirochaetaceae bacterium]